MHPRTSRRVLLTVPLTLSLFTAAAEPSRSAHAQPVSPRILVIADNQFHIPTGHAYYLQNGLADGIVSVAVRPPQSTLFGPFAFEALLRGAAADAIVLHLGDAADASCPVEMESFLAIMKRSGRPWLFTPGNHDGYFTGNSGHMLKNQHTWDRACGGQRLDKAGVVSSYMKARFGADVGAEIQRGTEAAKTPGAPEIAWAARVDAKAPHRSFVTQQIRVKTPDGRFARIVLLDTVEYDLAPKYALGLLLPGRYIAGVTGQILSDQKAIVEKWLKAGKAAGDHLLFAGHHPLKPGVHSDGLRLADSRWLAKKFKQYGVVAYLSAHTHQGGARPASAKPGSRPELNVASLVDWPLGVRTLQLNAEGLSSSETLFDTEHAMPAGLSGRCELHRAEWRPAADSFAAYTHYKDVPSGPTGRLMDHYLLVAELQLLRDAIARTAETLTDAQGKWLAATEARIMQARARLDKRLETSSLVEIRELVPLVREALDRYAAQRDSLSPAGHSRADLYAWCQLFWAAEADEARTSKLETVVGKRDPSGKASKAGWQDQRETRIPWAP